MGRAARVFYAVLSHVFGCCRLVTFLAPSVGTIREVTLSMVSFDDVLKALGGHWVTDGEGTDYRGLLTR